MKISMNFRIASFAIVLALLASCSLPAPKNLRPQMAYNRMEHPYHRDANHTLYAAYFEMKNPYHYYARPSAIEVGIPVTAGE